MRRGPFRACRAVTLAIGVALLLAAAPAWARVEGAPYVDNETLGLYHAVLQATDGPVEVFDEGIWGLEALDQLLAGTDAMAPERYLVAFSSYAVAHVAMRLPAYRGPANEGFHRFVDKMLYSRSWEDWIMDWGGTNPLGPDNIMFTGHLHLMLTLGRQIFDDPSYTDTLSLRMHDGPEFTTTASELTASLDEQAAAYLDAAGEHIHNIACEPGRIFVPCNTPHRIAFVSIDRMDGTSYADSNTTWLDWVDARMVDEATGVTYDQYWPFGQGQSEMTAGAVPERQDRLSGMYNGWTVWFLQGIDEARAAELYESYLAHFVTTDELSGLTIVTDGTGVEGLLGTGLDLAATGFGLVNTGLFGDEELQAELFEYWDWAFEPPVWSADGRVLAHSDSPFPRLIPDAFDLLARVVSPESNWVTNAETVTVDESALPRILRVTNEATFVNQAYWDAEEERLIVTVNGGAATTDPTDIVLGNLDADRTLVVTRDGEPFAEWRREGQEVILTTPPLTGTEESYIVTFSAPSDADAAVGEPDAGTAFPGAAGGGCGCRTAEGSPTAAWMLAALLALAPLARRGTRSRRHAGPACGGRSLRLPLP